MLKQFFARITGSQPDPREEWRDLWHQVVKIARNPDWYSDCKVADSVDGRFDMITVVLSVAMVRVEASPALQSGSAMLTEFFVDDMDAQLREFGVNDVVVGKRIGKLMSVMGGRIGSYRPALNQRDEAKLIAAIDRNVTFAEGGDPACVSAKMLELSDRMARASDEDIKAAKDLA